jgi:organic radical activating enzyme
MEGVNQKLAVSETFYSIQGEGATMGKPAVFLRLAACNLLCGGKGTDKDKQLHDGASWRCDTIEVWQKGETKEFKDVLSADLLQELSRGAHLIITGGEPLLQQERIYQYLEYLLKFEFVRPVIEIETNGTILPLDKLLEVVNHWNVSPKLSNSGETYNRRFNYIALSRFAKMQTAIFKFVVSRYSDWTEIAEMRDKVNIMTDAIWLMPACSNIKDLLGVNQKVAKLALEMGANFSTRLQIEIWNETVGV